MAQMKEISMKVTFEEKSVSLENLADRIMFLKNLEMDVYDNDHIMTDPSLNVDFDIVGNVRVYPQDGKVVYSQLDKIKDCSINYAGPCINVNMNKNGKNTCYSFYAYPKNEESEAQK